MAQQKAIGGACATLSNKEQTMVQSKIIMAVACVATMATVGAASAADLPPYLAPSMVDNAVDYAVPPADRWTGLYAGAHLGAGFINQPGGDQRAIFGGLQAGYNQQFGQFVVGGELEGSYNNRLQHRISGGGVYEQTWSGSAKARAGVALDSILLFGTAGVAVARLDAKGAITSGDRWQAGLAFGGGVEFAFSESMSAKLEYTQTRFNNVPSTSGGIGRSDNLVNHAVTAGINYRF